MGADTKIKQELLGTLDEDVATNGPKFFQEEFMGYDSMGNLLENITTTVNNGIYDDLIEQGVPEDKVSKIFQYIASVRDNMKYDLSEMVQREHNYCIVDEVDSILIDDSGSINQRWVGHEPNLSSLPLHFNFIG